MPYDIFRIEVAIKEGISQDAHDEMLHEARAMIRVSKHENIVNLQGISVKKNSIYLLLEFCAFGPMDTFLKNHETEYKNLMKENNFDPLIKWCRDISDGMKFLVENEVIHVSFTHTLTLRF